MKAWCNSKTAAPAHDYWRPPFLFQKAGAFLCVVPCMRQKKSSSVSVPAGKGMSFTRAVTFVAVVGTAESRAFPVAASVKSHNPTCCSSKNRGSLVMRQKSSSVSVPAGKGTSFARAVKLGCKLSARLKAVPFPLPERFLRIVDDDQSEEYSVLPTRRLYAQRV